VYAACSYCAVITSCANPETCAHYETIEIQKEETYRSEPRVNTPDDMIQVTFICSKKEWNGLKRAMTAKPIGGDDA
jgi:hypothetical protein